MSLYCLLNIENHGSGQIDFDTNLRDFLGVYQMIFGDTRYCIISLESPTKYFIHCDLLDRGKNLFNGKKSSILAFFDAKEVPYEKESNHASSQQGLRDCTTGEYVNSIKWKPF